MHLLLYKKLSSSIRQAMFYSRGLCELFNLHDLFQANSRLRWNNKQRHNSVKLLFRQSRFCQITLPHLGFFWDVQAINSGGIRRCLRHAAVIIPGCMAACFVAVQCMHPCVEDWPGSKEPWNEFCEPKWPFRLVSPPSNSNYMVCIANCFWNGVKGGAQQLLWCNTGSVI